MKKINIKRLLSLVMLLLVVFPVLVSASSPSTIITKVFFQDETGNMVYVNYENAINQSMEGNNTLYNGIKHYVGIAEVKGKAIYLETNTGKKIDFKLAMTDNFFRLGDILTKPKYEVNREIDYTHELKVVDGSAVIAPKSDQVNVVRINPVSDITVNVGTSMSDAIRSLQPTTTIVDSKNVVHTVNLIWAIDNYNKDVVGVYRAEARFALPQGIENGLGLTLKVEAMVTVVAVTPDWPAEVEGVFVGISEITDITYANIEIKSEHVSVVKAVYVDGNPANKVEGKPSQWRIEVARGTTVEQLKKRVRVEVEGTVNPPENPIVNVEVRNSSPMLPMLLQLKVNAQGIPNAAKYDIVYELSGGAGSNTAKFNLGEWTTESIFFNPQTITDKITVRIYDASGNNILHTFVDVVIQNPMIPK